jgi:hypothetical protein
MMVVSFVVGVIVRSGFQSPFIARWRHYRPPQNAHISLKALCFFIRRCLALERHLWLSSRFEPKRFTAGMEEG